MTADKHQNQPPLTIKKYANRRLYNTETSTYITLEDLSQMVKQGREFVVVDANTGTDLTSQVLTQIILERELKGEGLLPTAFLRSVIRFYDDRVGGMMQHYLDASMKTFVQNRDKMHSAFGDMGKVIKDFTPMQPLQQFEEMAKQNMAFFEKAASSFTPGSFNPFAAFFGHSEEPEKPGKPGGKK